MAGNTFGLLDSLQCKLMNRAAWSTFSKSSSSGSQASTWTSLARSEVAGATPAALADCFSMGCVSSGFLEGVSSGFHLLQDITYLPTWDKNTSSLGVSFASISAFSFHPAKPLGFARPLFWFVHLHGTRNGKHTKNELENHHFVWENSLYMAIFNSYFDTTRGYIHQYPSIIPWLSHDHAYKNIVNHSKPIKP